jgi:probable F420-dependent oxidoreductase
LKFLYCFPGMTVPTNLALTSADGLIDLALAAEEAGFAGVGLDDHPATPESWRPRDRPQPAGFDPLIGLAAVAGATTTIKLVTYAMDIPYRNPLITAKGVATLDLISKGRLILGTATGYVEEEARAVGTDFARRNERFDEAIEVCKRAWLGDPFDYEGEGFTASNVSVQPPTVQKPHPPIWIGGNSDRAMRRVAAGCQGWMPLGYRAGSPISLRSPPMDTAEQVQTRMNRLQRYLEEAGRDDPVEILFGGGAIVGRPAAEALDRLQELAAIGVTWVPLHGRETSLQEAKDGIRRMGEELVRPMAGAGMPADG